MAWSSLVEELVADPQDAARPQLSTGVTAKPLRLSEVQAGDESRITTGIVELDRVLGGGLVQGALVLVGGDPGIGKSTLLLQAVGSLAAVGQKVLYVSGEESLMQIKLRASRMGVRSDAVYLLATTSIEAMDLALRDIKPQILVVDSVQTVRDDTFPSAAGSVAQIRAVTQRLVDVSKGDNIATFVVGHVTKEGTIAGPKVMEHMVDTVLYFEGERTGNYRILRAHKNRFGSAQEIGVFDMQEDGLHPVTNPSALFLAQRAQGPGATVVTSVEGSRPLLLEVQALVTPAFLGGTPRRNTTGFDHVRVSMLCAVLAARADIDLGGSDVFVNMAGGVRVSEPAADLGVILALASAACGTAIPADWLSVGEVGLSGEVRAASSLPARLKEAAALGFASALVPHVAVADLRDKTPLELHGVSNVASALSICGMAPNKPASRRRS